MVARTLTVALGLITAFSAEAAADPVIMAAGDIACDPTDPGYNGGAGSADRCHQQATSDLLLSTPLDAVLPLGDIQYDSATTARIDAVYAPTWGRVKSISRPILGNHEPGGATGYFDYFNGPGVSDGPAGPRGKGYYSFDLGGWHLVALNSNCSSVSCSAGSEQESWLRADLAAHPTSCTLAYWHHARYSSGHDGSNAFMQPLWEALQDAQAELLLSGHSHDYERFAPLDRDGEVDLGGGIRQFVVGTGGAFFTGGLGSLEAHSEVAQNDTFGVLKLTLHPSSYDWQFIPEAGRTFADAGTQPCHGLVAPPPVAAAPDRTAPVITRLRLGPRPIRRTSAFRYELSEPAKVKFTIKRKAKGRYRSVGEFAQLGAAGANKRLFRAKIRARRLRPGTFEARLRAIDAAGNRSAPRTIGFRVVQGVR
jgi:calcineurin-like phosphoesterase family protein